MVTTMYRVEHLDGREDIYSHTGNVLVNETSNSLVKQGCDLDYVDRLFLSMDAKVLEKVFISTPNTDFNLTPPTESQVKS